MIEFFKPIPLSLHSKNKKADLVAQLVEQYTFNVWALGSSPSQITNPRIPGVFYLINLSSPNNPSIFVTIYDDPNSSKTK